MLPYLVCSHHKFTADEKKLIKRKIKRQLRKFAEKSKEKAKQSEQEGQSSSSDMVSTGIPSIPVIVSRQVSNHRNVKRQNQYSGSTNYEVNSQYGKRQKFAQNYHSNDDDDKWYEGLMPGVDPSDGNGAFNNHSGYNSQFSAQNNYQSSNIYNQAPGFRNNHPRNQPGFIGGNQPSFSGNQPGFNGNQPSFSGNKNSNIPRNNPGSFNKAGNISRNIRVVHSNLVSVQSTNDTTNVQKKNTVNVQKTNKITKSNKTVAKAPVNKTKKADASAANKGKSSKDNKVSSPDNKDASKSVTFDSEAKEDGDDSWPSLKDIVALDCEFVGVGPKKLSEIGRCSVVDASGQILCDIYAKPHQMITDYRTKWSGLRKHNFKNAIPCVVAKQMVAKLIKGKVVVGHAVHNDFSVLKIPHPARKTRDTSQCKVLKQKAGLNPGEGVSLKTLAQTLLDKKIQTGEHCSVVDARTSMDLYRLIRDEWETSICGERKRRDSEASHDPSSFLGDSYWPKDV